MFIRFALVFLGMILAGLAIEKTSPVFALWFASAVLALISFGYIMAFHLFRKAEKDLSKKWKEIMAISLAVNFFRLMVVFLLAFFPILLIAFIMASIMLFLSRDYE